VSARKTGENEYKTPVQLIAIGSSSQQVTNISIALDKNGTFVTQHVLFGDVEYTDTAACVEGEIFVHRQKNGVDVGPPSRLPISTAARMLQPMTVSFLVKTSETTRIGLGFGFGRYAGFGGYTNSLWSASSFVNDNDNAIAARILATWFTSNIPFSTHMDKEVWIGDGSIRPSISPVQGWRWTLTNIDIHAGHSLIFALPKASGMGQLAFSVHHVSTNAAMQIVDVQSEGRKLQQHPSGMCIGVDQMISVVGSSRCFELGDVVLLHRSKGPQSVAISFDSNSIVALSLSFVVVT
jgi:hypothetical protein